MTEPSVERSPGKRPRILVVDDEEVLRDLIRRKLTSDGTDVLIAKDGVDACAVLDRERVDAVLTDIKMPGRGGIEVLKHAKSIDRDVEVLVMTAHACADTAIEAVRFGAFDYLTKPFERFEDLSHKLRQALTHQRLVRQNREMLARLDEANRRLKQLLTDRTRELNEAQDGLRRANDDLRASMGKRDRLVGDLLARLSPALEEVQATSRDLRDGDLETAGLRSRLDAVHDSARSATGLLGRVVAELALPAASGAPAGEPASHASPEQAAP